MKDTIIKIFPSGQVFLTNNILGYEGEHISRNIVVKMDNFIDGIALLEIEREIDGKVEKEVLTMDKQDETYVLPIYESLLTANKLDMQLLIMIDEEVVFKSEVFKLKVGNAINAKDREFLEEYASYIYKFDEKIAEIDKLIEDIKNGIVNIEPSDGEMGTLVVKFDDLTEDQKASLKGPQGENGLDGKDGTNGITPTIGDNGNWFIGETDTGVLAKGVNGKDGEQGIQGEPGKDGRDGIDGKDGTMTFEELTEEQRESLRGSSGKDGTNGIDGQDGKDGENGATFTPNVDEDGNLSWSNDKGLPNPETINIKGLQGEQGIQGIQGEPGETYNLTEEDCQNIANIVLNEMTNAEEVKF